MNEEQVLATPNEEEQPVQEEMVNVDLSNYEVLAHRGISNLTFLNPFIVLTVDGLLSIIFLSFSLVALKENVFIFLGLFILSIFLLVFSLVFFFVSYKRFRKSDYLTSQILYYDVENHHYYLQLKDESIIEMDPLKKIKVAHDFVGHNETIFKYEKKKYRVGFMVESSKSIQKRIDNIKTYIEKMLEEAKKAEEEAARLAAEEEARKAEEEAKRKEEEKANKKKARSKKAKSEPKEEKKEAKPKKKSSKPKEKK